MNLKFKLSTLFITVICLCSCIAPLTSKDVEQKLNSVSLLPKSEQYEKLISISNSSPLNSFRIIKYLIKNKLVSDAVIKQVAHKKRISIKKVLENISAPNIVITPLYHSASLTINSSDKSSNYYVQYKMQGSQEWLTSPTNYDLSSDTFTTSILDLTENMIYEVQVSQKNNFKNKNSFTFTTKSVPVFLASNIYNLADIYDGGVLDLVKLNIKGSENNWIKIIGDENTVISTSDAFESAINIGSNSYIYFENITITGGGRNAVSSNQAHHIWFNGCDISQWGRITREVRDGKSYAQKGDNRPINYDSAFSLIKTGVVTIENCQVHSPRTKANTWKRGHPHGANAVLIDASHSNQDYQGQIVVRNNRFYGTDQHRFNDVIESRNNGSSYGGFVRDSAIYNNYLAFANDDIIEIDGSQANVLVYNNEIEQGYCGISAIPNRQGPSYIFNNYIHNLGDEDNRSWAAIKLGGLVSRPAGKVNIFNNFIETNSNGIASAKYNGDSTFWVDAWSNIILVTNYKKNRYGYSVLEREPFNKNKYNNNFLYNFVTKNSLVKVNDNEKFNQNNYDYLPKYLTEFNKEFTFDEAMAFITLLH